MIRAFLACSLLAASAGGFAAGLTPSADDALVSSAPWWEKLVVTMGGGGAAPACIYVSSLAPGESQKCDVEGGAMREEAGAADGKSTSITFERRFSPGMTADAGQLAPGDTLIGKSVIALAIDASGRVKGCKVVASAGEMTPDYGCKEAAAERFQTAAPAAEAALKAATMTILVYGHEEHYA